MSVSNHDWARRLAEPTTETIQAELRGTARIPFSERKVRLFVGEELLLQLSETQTAGLHTLIRQAIALELEKLEHRFSARHDAIAPGNAAYWIAERAQEIRSWKPSWCTVTTWQDGEEEEQPFGQLDEAVADLVIGIPGTTKKLRMR